MPEIAEIARAVHNLRKSIVGKTLAVVKAQDDANVFGKVGTTGAEFQKAMTGKKVLSAGQQGKYFWLTMSSPPHPVFHFGMTGWMAIRGEGAAHYRPKESDEEEEWPPRFWKFIMQTKEEPKVEAAFTDARRFGRIRLVDCAAEDIRNVTPLKENGPDPVVDRDVLTQEWLVKKMRSKHVPVKALLLDQANISGIGNWVGDEILYYAKLHPEQYSDTFSDDQLAQLHTSIMYVCQTAVDLLGDSSKFPEDWLFKHRWGKGKKDAPTTLPSGAKITFLTVGGRTSCVVPSVQKKTGAVAGDLKKEAAEDGSDGDLRAKQKPTKRKGRSKKVKEESEADVDVVEEQKPSRSQAKGRAKIAKDGNDEDKEPEVEVKAVPKSSRKRKAVEQTDEPEAEPKEITTKRRATAREPTSKSTNDVSESKVESSPRTGGRVGRSNRSKPA